MTYVMGTLSSYMMMNWLMAAVQWTMGRVHLRDRQFLIAFTVSTFRLYSIQEYLLERLTASFPVDKIERMDI